MENIKGVLKREVGSFELRDCEIANIIINSLIDSGYDVVSNPILNNSQYQVGEQITIYRITQR